MSSFVGAVPRGNFFLWRLTAGRTTGISHDYSNSNDNNNRLRCEEPCHLMTDSNVCLELPPADPHQHSDAFIIKPLLWYWGDILLRAPILQGHPAFPKLPEVSVCFVQMLCVSRYLGSISHPHPCFLVHSKLFLALPAYLSCLLPWALEFWPYHVLMEECF